MVQDFRGVLFELLRAGWDGFKVCEIGYRYLQDGPYRGRIGYDGFYAKPAKQIDFALNPMTLQVEYLTSYTPATGTTSRFRWKDAYCTRTTRKPVCRTAWATGEPAISTGSVRTT